MFKRIFVALIIAAFGVATAAAQSSPGFTQGQVPTAAQWNSYFAMKQDFLNYTPLNQAGGVMTGRLVLTPSTSIASGLNVSPGTAPTSPQNGDVWVTTAGLFVRINGSTVGPLIGGTFNLAQVINLNTASAPAGLTGTIFQAVQADSVIARFEADAFSAAAHFSVVRTDGTNLSKTAVQSGDEIGSFNAFEYNGASVVGPVAAVKAYAAENAASGHQGSKVCLSTTPTASTTLTDSACQQASGGVTIGATTDPGAGGINVLGPVQHNNTDVVYSFNGRTDAVSPATGDYTTQQLTQISSGSSPAAGKLGEVISGVTAQASAVGMTNNTAQNVSFAPLSLTAGHWACTGNVGIIDVTGTTTSAIGWISLTSATIPAAPNAGGRSDMPISLAGSTVVFNIGPFFVNISATTNVYLSGQASFSGSTTLFGAMNCERHA